MTWETPCGGRRAYRSHLSLDTVWNRSASLTSHRSETLTGLSADPRPPHTSPLTHMLEPYTTMYVSTAIRVIADYIHNCLTQVGQTYITPQLGFLTVGLKEDCSECWLLISRTNGVPLWNLFLFIDRICFSVIFTSLPLSQTGESCEIWLARRHMHRMKTHTKCLRFEACWWISGQCVTDR